MQGNTLYGFFYTPDSAPWGVVLHLDQPRDSEVIMHLIPFPQGV